MKFVFFIISIFLFLFTSNAQIGIDIENPLPATSLHIEGSESGVLINRVSLDGTDDAVLGTITLDASYESLMVYNTNLSSNADASTNVSPGFYFWNGSNWVNMAGATSSNDFTGWADYVDGTYTEALPFEINTTKLTLPNNANTVRASQKPLDISTFYDASTSTITGRNGDGINILIEFKAKPTSNGNTRLTVAIDIGAPVGEIYPRDFVLSKGNGVEHSYLSSFNAYTLGTWEANGGTVKIASTAPADIYDIRYVITRTHKAR